MTAMWENLTVAQAVIVVAVIWLLWQVAMSVIERRRRRVYDVEYAAERRADLEREERKEQLLRTLVDYVEEQTNELQRVHQAVDAADDAAAERDRERAACTA